MCVVLAGLCVPAGAVASTAAPRVVAAASWVAGHPVTVACDADTNPSPFPAAPGAVITAWTLTGGNVIHALPAICGETDAEPGTTQFADGIATMLHEAARARGLTSDSCVELFADIGVFDVLRRFYGIAFFSDMSVRIGSQVLGLTRQRPASYQPATCWASGALS